MNSTGRNEPCPCGSGKKFKKCCVRHVSTSVIRHISSGQRVISMSEGTTTIIERQYQRFKEKFGREVGPKDPVFFDPDADVPMPMSEEKLTRLMVEQMESAGMSREFIYAFKKTGMTVLDGNEHLFSEADLVEWKEAIAEFHAKNGTGRA